MNDPKSITFHVKLLFHNDELLQKQGDISSKNSNKGKRNHPQFKE